MSDKLLYEALVQIGRDTLAKRADKDRLDALQAEHANKPPVTPSPFVAAMAAEDREFEFRGSTFLVPGGQPPGPLAMAVFPTPTTTTPRASRFAAWAAGLPPLRKRAPAQEVEVGITVEVAKVKDDEQFFLGWASVTSVDGEIVMDKQGDVIDIDELEATAAAFMRDHAAGLVMHAGTPSIRYTTSIVITAAVKRALGMTLTPDREGWLVGGYVTDPVIWARIRSGELTALSIGGTGVRDPL